MICNNVERLIKALLMEKVDRVPVTSMMTGVTVDMMKQLLLN